MDDVQRSILHLLNDDPTGLHNMAGRLAKGSAAPDELLRSGWAQKIGGRYRITPEGAAALEAESALTGGYW